MLCRSRSCHRRVAPAAPRLRLPCTVPARRACAAACCHAAPRPSPLHHRCLPAARTCRLRFALPCHCCTLPSATYCSAAAAFWFCSCIAFVAVRFFLYATPVTAFTRLLLPPAATYPLLLVVYVYLTALLLRLIATVISPHCRAVRAPADSMSGRRALVIGCCVSGFCLYLLAMLLLCYKPHRRYSDGCKPPVSHAAG